MSDAISQGMRKSKGGPKKKKQTMMDEFANFAAMRTSKTLQLQNDVLQEMKDIK
jgi:hypothetical protein